MPPSAVWIVVLTALCLSSLAITSFCCRKKITRAEPVIGRFFVYWDDEENLNETRATSIEMLRTSSPGLKMHLVSRKSFPQYEVEGHPVHPAFSHLSAVHRADYARLYLTYHYGGGYHDVKPRSTSMAQAYKRFMADENFWVLGVGEVSPDHIASNPNKTSVQEKYSSLISPGAFFAKKGNPILAQTLQEVENILDTKLEALKENPPPKPRCCMTREEAQGYPLRWAEILGEVFHFHQADNLKHIDTRLERWDDGSYL